MRSTITNRWWLAICLAIMFLLATAFTVKPDQISSGQLTYLYKQGKKAHQQTIEAKQAPFLYKFSTTDKVGKQATISLEYSDQHYWYHRNDQGRWVKMAKTTAFSPSSHLLAPDDFSQLLWSLQPQKNWQQHQQGLHKCGSVYILTSKQKKVLKQSQTLVDQLAPQAGKIKSMTWRCHLKKHQVKRLTYVFKCQRGQVQLIYSHLNGCEQMKIPNKVRRAPTQAANEGRG